MAGKGWIILIIIIVAGFQIYNGLKGFAETNDESDEWTEEDRTLLVEKCIKETGDNGILYPDIARNYCECGHEKLFTKFSKAEYVEIIKKPAEEQIAIAKPVFQDCLITYENALKSQQGDEWTDAEYQRMVEKCIQTSKESFDKYPAITRTYCECSRTKIIEAYGKNEFAELMSKTPEEQEALVKDCTADFQSAIGKSEE